MPIKIKSSTTTVSASDLLKAFQKNMGEGVGDFGGKLVNTERIPTGIFPLDLALGGGFPRGKSSIIVGVESSGKTNLALLAIANHQKLWPELTCIFVDLENSYDPQWAKLLGVDTDRLMVLKPSYAEQAVDMVEALLLAEDCGLIVIDSIAAMISTAEAEGSADRVQVGGSSLVCSKLSKKVVHAQIEAAKEGHYPTVIYINQIRVKIGVMFGNPETMPGGNAIRYQSAMTLRVYGKSVMDSKVSAVMPVMKETTFGIQKFKVPIFANSGKFSMVTFPHKGFRVGQADDFNTVSEYLKNFGEFEKGPNGKGWIICGEAYDTIQPFKDRLNEDYAFGQKIRQSIFDRLAPELQQEQTEDED